MSSNLLLRGAVRPLLRTLAPRCLPTRGQPGAVRAVHAAAAAQAKIVYTYTDEAPMLATYSLLPMIRRFTDPAGVEVELSDISVAARILAQFPERLTAEQRAAHGRDQLAELGELAKTPEANIIKLPNVSASIPQLVAAIAELQAHGFAIPDFPAEPQTAEEKATAAQYAKVLGSAVNPVLREGNSDRRVAAPVKAYAQANPHRLGAWKADCRTSVAHMSGGDFFESEQSTTMAEAGSVRIEHVAGDGTVTVLKEETALLAGEVIDASFMSTRALRAFLEAEISECHESDLMVSLHLKATMMKVSDPIIFGHAVTVFFKAVFEKHAAALADAGVNPSNGLGDLYDKLDRLPAATRAEVEADLEAAYASRPRLAMVDSARGITNLHVPSDVIIDASMPVVMRDSGCMWNKDDALEEVKCIIPDRCYAGIYKEMVDFLKEKGQFDVSTMGNVSNVGLMAQKAEEYGSHDKTFVVPADGKMRVVHGGSGDLVFEHLVEAGDIWRMCQTKNEPIRDWVRLAVSRARATGAAAVFWLTPERAHDRSIIAKVEQFLADHDTAGLDLSIQAPAAAMRTSCERAAKGLDTISVTGNVLRDYLTDLFPILELGTSAKMLSIVPLLNGGAMFETGAGGSAPKHVQQFTKEGHLRWDSLGEYLALAVSLEDLGEKTGNARAKLLGETLTKATGKVLDNRLSPSRKVNELDNRGTSFHLAKYWAAEMSTHDAAFKPLAEELAASEEKIAADLVACQGAAQDIGGYYQPDHAKAEAAMRPSPTLNALFDTKGVC